MRKSFGDSGVGSLLPLLAAADTRLRLAAAAALSTYSCCDQGLAALGAGRTKPSDVVGAHRPLSSLPLRPLKRPINSI